MTASMSLGVFQHMRINLQNEMKKSYDIEVKPKTIVRAITKNIGPNQFGEALAEIQATAALKKDDKEYKVNIIMYQGALI